MPVHKLTRTPENQAGLVTLVAIQYITTKAALVRDENIFPTEMERQVSHTCLSRRADPREEVEAHVQEKPPCCRPNGPQLFG